MSNLTQFAPFASGGLKSFQTGYAASAGSNGTGQDYIFLDITTSSVTVAKTVTGFEGSIGISLPDTALYSGDGGGRSFRIVFTRMTSTTNLRLSNSATLLGFSSVFVNGRWQIAEAN